MVEKTRSTIADAINVVQLILLVLGFLYGRFVVIEKLTVSHIALEQRVAKDEEEWKALALRLTAHHEDTSVHLTDRDINDIKDIKTDVNQLKADQQALHHLLISHDRRMSQPR